ncbi:MAG: hypothetical protein R2706_08380 [Acidimicrobiales bacterium]
MVGLISFVGGLFGLVLGGHLVVDGAASIGRRFGLSPMVIGLTIVAAARVRAWRWRSCPVGRCRRHRPAVGSVVASNIANVPFVLGIVAALGSVQVVSRLVRWDIPIMISASLPSCWSTDAVARRRSARGWGDWACAVDAPHRESWTTGRGGG